MNQTCFGPSSDSDGDPGSCWKADRVNLKFVSVDVMNLKYLCLATVLNITIIIIILIAIIM